MSSLRDGATNILSPMLKGLTRLLVSGVRRLDPDFCINLFGSMSRRIGPWLGRSRVGRENLRAAFPEKSEAEIEAILAGVWENLGRFVGELLHIDRLWDWDLLNPGHGRMTRSDPTFERLIEVRDDGKPSLVFTCHLGNWELTAVAAAALGARFALLFRPPNNRFAAEMVQELRRRCMGRLISTKKAAVFALAQEIEAGIHIGMLVDQYWSGGPRVTFFGRPCSANPTIARLARQFECEVRGARAMRLPGNRYRFEMTEPLDLPRDAAGKIDVGGSMQMITSVMEGWIREDPAQWLWLHRRWREAV
jgi:KDO2-lipid IV(A) lauroyltransferase